MSIFRFFVSYNPGNMRALISKGSALVKLGKPEEAVKIWKEGLQKALHHGGDIILYTEISHQLSVLEKEVPPKAEGMVVSDVFLRPLRLDCLYQVSVTTMLSGLFWYKG